MPIFTNNSPGNAPGAGGMSALSAGLSAMTAQLSAMSTSLAAMAKTTNNIRPNVPNFDQPLRNSAGILTNWRSLGALLSDAFFIKEMKELMSMTGSLGVNYHLANVELETRNKLFKTGFMVAAETGVAFEEIGKLQGALFALGQRDLTQDREKLKYMAMLKDGLHISVGELAQMARIAKVNNTEFTALSDTISDIATKSNVTGEEMAKWVVELNKAGAFYGRQGTIPQITKTFSAIQGAIKGVTGDTSALMETLMGARNSIMSGSILNGGRSPFDEATMRKTAKLADQLAKHFQSQAQALSGTGISIASAKGRILSDMLAKTKGISQSFVEEAAKMRAAGTSIEAEMKKNEERAAQTKPTTTADMFQSNMASAGLQLTLLERKLKSIVGFAGMPVFNALNQFLINTNLVFGNLIKWAKSLDPEDQKTLQKVVIGLAGALGTLLGIKGIQNVGSVIFGMFGKKGIGGAAQAAGTAGSTMSKTGGIISRFALNMVASAASFALAAVGIWVFTKALTEFSKLDDKKIGETLTRMAEAAGGLLAFSAALAGVGFLFDAIAVEMVPVLVAVAAGIAIAAAGFALFSLNVRLFMWAIKPAIGYFDQITKSVGRVIEMFTKYQKVKLAQIDAERSYLEMLGNIHDQLDDQGSAASSVSGLSSALDGLVGVLDKMDSRFTLGKTPLDNLGKFMEGVRKATGLSEFAANMTRIADAFERVAGSMSKLKFFDLGVTQISAMSDILAKINSISSAAPVANSATAIADSFGTKLQDNVDDIKILLSDIKIAIVDQTGFFQKKMADPSKPSTRFPGGARGDAPDAPGQSNNYLSAPIKLF